MRIVLRGFGILGFAVSSILFTSFSVSADVISWSFTDIVNTGGSGQFTGTGFLDNSGTLVFAENLGNGVTTTLDGISFAQSNFDLGSGNASVFHATAPITDTGTYGGANANDMITIGANDAANDGDELGGIALIPGNTYRLQLIVMDGRGGFPTRTIDIDGNMQDHATGISGATWGNALLATGTWTATTASNDFELIVRNDDGSSADQQLNAAALHIVPNPVPEPTALGLLALGGLICGVRRRRN